MFSSVNPQVFAASLEKQRQRLPPDRRLVFGNYLQAVRESQPRELDKNVFVAELTKQISEELLRLRNSSEYRLSPAQKMAVLAASKNLKFLTTVDSGFDELPVGKNGLPGFGEYGFGSTDALILIELPEAKPPSSFWVSLDFTIDDKREQEKPIVTDLEIWAKKGVWTDFAENSQKFKQNVGSISRVIAEIIVKRVTGQLDKLKPAKRTWPRAALAAAEQPLSY